MLEEENCKKKIALFSCHNDPNYGSMLQAYALVEALRKIGKESEYISYTINPVPNSLTTHIKHIIKVILSFLGLYKNNNPWGFFCTSEFASIMDAFKNFHTEYIPCTDKLYYADRMYKDFNPTAYDNFIVGSDQSWSPYIYNRKKPYFLDFAGIKHKQAYAPSMGTTFFTEEYKNLLKEKLSSFEHLSCREKSNAELLSIILGREVRCVLDPTLLLGPSDWDKIAIEPNISSPYVLSYILGEKDCIPEFAEKLGKEKDIPVYYILTRPNYLEKEYLINDAGPAEFLGLIKNAEYIVTDSYHGCLLSIEYNKNFYAFCKQGGDMNNLDNIRIGEFLARVGLESRLIKDNDMKILTDIDYSEPNEIIEGMRVNSYSYLNDIASV